jgi:hypothetical protein
MFHDFIFVYGVVLAAGLSATFAIVGIAGCVQFLKNKEYNSFIKNFNDDN